MYWKTAILALSIALGVAFLSSLGIWQLKRLGDKEELIARVVENRNNPAQSVSDIELMVLAGGDIEYYPMKAEGTFLHDREAHFFITHKGKPGYFIFTPLKMNDNRLLMVNRGFVPIDQKQVASRLEGQTKGRVQISGLARSAPEAAPNLFVPDNDIEKNIFYWKSLKEMLLVQGDKPAQEALPFFLDADESANQGGLPIGGVTLIQFPNNHLQYAYTWFGLALTLLLVGGFFLRTRLRTGNL